MKINETNLWGFIVGWSIVGVLCWNWYCSVTLAIGLIGTHLNYQRCVRGKK